MTLIVSLTAQVSRAARRITAVASPMVMACSTVLSSGCSGDDPNEGGSVPEGAIALTDANNFTATAQIAPPVFDTAVGDVQIDWTSVTQNLLCHDVAPRVESVYLIRVELGTEQAVVDSILAGTLSGLPTKQFTFRVPDGAATSASLSNFMFGEVPIELGSEYFASDSETYLMLFSTGTSVRKGAQSMLFLNPTAASTVTQVTAETGCGMLTYSANLATLTPVQVPVAGPWVVDWSGAKRTGDGKPSPHNDIDRVLVGFYSGRDVAYIQENIFDIERDPQATLWEIQHQAGSGRSANLADAKAKHDGSAFAGFQTSEQGTWLLGLFCSTCTNPAPVFLTVIQPTG